VICEGNRLAFGVRPCEIDAVQTHWIRDDPHQVASVAQLAEQLTLNQLVLGSSPSRGTSEKSGVSSNFLEAKILTHSRNQAIAPAVGKRFRITLALFLVATVAFVAWQVSRRPEPHYAGKPVSYWIARSGEYYEGSDFGRIGGFPRNADSNAIPYLLKALNKRENVFSGPYFKIWLKLPVQVQSRLPPPINAEQMRYSTAMSLGYMGNVGKATIPALIRALKEDDSEHVRGESACALGRLGNQETLVIVALTNALNDRAAFVREQAADALALSGRAAQSAVPALVKCRDDKYAEVRSNAKNALKAIDSEAAERVGFN
jgi:HEAT repeats